MDLADKLVQHRKKQGWTQAVAAKNIEIQQSYLSKLESGQYHPSDEVINKLCSAYSIKAEELLPSSKNSSKTLSFIVTGIIGFSFLLIGYFSLIFPQTYYTYKAIPIENVVLQEQVSIKYHVTDHYQGEKYIRHLQSGNYEYSLVAQRSINRTENRWLIALGCLFMFFTISAAIYKLIILRK